MKIQPTPAQEKFISDVKEYAYSVYETGGDLIIELLTDDDILWFEDMEHVKKYIEFEHANRLEIESTIW